MLSSLDLRLILSLVSALSVLAVIIGLYHINRRIQLRSRLKEVGRDVSEEATLKPLLERPLPWYARVIGFFGVLLPNQCYSDTLRMELWQAGYHNLDARAVFAGTRVLCTAALGMGTLIFAYQMALAENEIILVTAVAAASGYLLPQMLLRWKQGKRQQELTLTLPDALDLLVICVEAGQALNAAILSVGKEIRHAAPALSQELSLVNHEMRAGMSRTQALRNLALRTGVDDVRALVAVLVQSDRFGTSVAQALRIHAKSLRTRRRQRAEETARKAPVKLVFPLVFCIFPELMVVILAPGMLEMFRALADMARG